MIQQEIEERFRTLLAAEKQRQVAGFSGVQAINGDRRLGDGFGGRFFEPSHQMNEVISQDMGLPKEGVVDISA